MRLFRLTTQNDTALFEATYNTQIILKPYSKIALQSASIDSIIAELLINSTNNEIQYQIIAGYSKTIQLTHGSYTSSQLDSLLTDITNLLNDSVEYTFGVTTINKPLGLQWLAEEKDKKIQISYKIGRSSSYFQTLTNWTFNDTSITAPEILGSNVGSTNDFTQNCGFPFPISEGCGFFRARMYRLEYDIDNTEQGYIIGVVTDFDKIDTDTLALTDIKYGVRVDVDNLDVRTYESIVNGVLTGDISYAQDYVVNSNNNEYIDISINGGNVEISSYYKDNENLTAKDIIFTEVYDRSLKLFPTFVFFGKKSDVACNGVRVTPNPYFSLPVFNGSTDDTSLVSPPLPPPNPNINAENYLYMNVELSSYLGYSNPNQPVSGTSPGVEITYVAQNVFSIPEIADAMLVQLMNLQIESYDSYSNTAFPAGGQRKNLLCVIPSTNSSGKIVYEPNYLTFLDLQNAEPIILRNLNVRVVREDYSEIEINGMGTLVIIID